MRCLGIEAAAALIGMTPVIDHKFQFNTVARSPIGFAQLRDHFINHGFLGRISSGFLQGVTKSTRGDHESLMTHWGRKPSQRHTVLGRFAERRQGLFVRPCWVTCRAFVTTNPPFQSSVRTVDQSGQGAL